MGLNRAAGVAASWQQTVAGIPTMMGRFAYLASLRNTNSGKYEHYGLAQRVSPEEADQLIRDSHNALFQQWLCFGLERQKQELEDYFASLEGDKRAAVATWLSIEPYSAWIPAEARTVERRLFISDLQVVLDLIRADYGVAGRDPDS